MDFELPEEYRMLQDTVRRFVRQELMPLETTGPGARYARHDR